MIQNPNIQAPSQGIKQMLQYQSPQTSDPNYRFVYPNSRSIDNLGMIVPISGINMRTESPNREIRRVVTPGSALPPSQQLISKVNNPADHANTSNTSLVYQQQQQPQYEQRPVIIQRSIITNSPAPRGITLKQESVYNTAAPESEISVLQQKIQFLENSLENSSDLENTNNLINLQAYIQKEIYDLKQKNEEAKKKNDENLINNAYHTQQKQQLEGLIDMKSGMQNYIKDLERVNSELKNQYDTNLRENSDLKEKVDQLEQQLQNNQNSSPYNSSYFNEGDKNQVQLQIQNLNDTIGQLSNELDQVSQINKQYQDFLNQQDFFQQYDKMCKQVEGIRTENFKISNMLKQQNQQIAKLTGKQVQPINNPVFQLQN